MSALTLWVHDAGFSPLDAVLNLDLFPHISVDSIVEIVDVVDKSKRFLFVVRPFDAVLKKKQPHLQLSIHAQVASVFGFQSRCSVLIRAVDRSLVEINRVEFTVRDQCLSRNDMWRLAGSLVDDCIYVGKTVTFIGAIRATVKQLFVHGQRASCGFVTPSTKPVFRSESSKFYLFIQMSREMWEFEEDGEIVFNKAINGFLPKLFHRWRRLNSHHLVSIALFTRVEYDGDATSFTEPSQSTEKSNYQDFYRVVVSNMLSTDPSALLMELKKEFGWFMRDVLTQYSVNQRKPFLCGKMSHALHGNILEAINMVAGQYSQDLADRDFNRTGVSIIIVSPGTGQFEVDYSLLKITSEILLSNGVSIDLVCLSNPPLHSMPLFKYKLPSSNDWCYAVPQWLGVSYHTPPKEKSEAHKFKTRCKMYELQMMGIMENDISSIAISYLHDSDSYHFNGTPDDDIWMDKYDDAAFRPLKGPENILQYRGTHEDKFSKSTSSRHEVLQPNRYADYATPPKNMSPSNSSNKMHFVKRLMKTNHGSGLYLKSSPTIGAIEGANMLVSSDSEFQHSNPLPIPSKESGYSQSRISADNETFSDGSKPKSSFTNPQRMRRPNKDAEDNFLPWLCIKNPSNPSLDVISEWARYRRWQHALPQYGHQSRVLWLSLCAPAILPLTTEINDLATLVLNNHRDYTYTISLDTENGEITKEELVKQMIGQRLTQNFQIIVNEENQRFLGNNLSDCIYMTLGNQIHRISMNAGSNIEVKRYVRNTDNTSVRYEASICAALGKEFERCSVEFTSPEIEMYNWNYVDQILGGYDEGLALQLRNCSARFLFLPMEISSRQVQNHPLAANWEDFSDEELRVAGVNKLVSLFQKGISEEKASRVKTKNDHELMNVLFTTTDPATFVAQEYEALLYGPYTFRMPLLMSGNEELDRSVNLSMLANELQSPRGIKIKDRRWHWRLFESVFVGSELISWMVENFRDITDRATALEFGNTLIERGLFEHCTKRHPFLDGHYFYCFKDKYAITSKNSSKGWFGSRKSTSAEKSPTSPDQIKIEGRSRSSSNAAALNQKIPISPSINEFQGRRPRIVLSSCASFDIDPQKRSYRPEIIQLHYYRIYNPDHCFHIYLDWVNVTFRLMEETLSSWARIGERYGLRLVEAPLQEAHTIPQNNPFRTPIRIQLIEDPSMWLNIPDEPDCRPIIHFRREILLKHGYVLDIEATKNFPTKDVEVIWSWGSPAYKYSQYIHKSGLVFAQINDQGEFLLMINRQMTFRTFVSSRTEKRENTSKLAKDLEDFCGSREKIRAFYTELLNQSVQGDERRTLRRASATPSLVGSEISTNLNDGGSRLMSQEFLNTET